MASGCAFPSGDCFITKDKEVDWDELVDEIGFAAADAGAIGATPHRYQATPTGDSEGIPGLDGAWDLSFDLDRSRLPRFQRTDPGPRCWAQASYADLGRRFVVPIRIDAGTTDGSFRFAGPTWVMVSQLNPPIMGASDWWIPVTERPDDFDEWVRNTHGLVDQAYTAGFVGPWERLTVDVSAASADEYVGGAVLVIDR